MRYVKDSPLELGFRVWQLRPPAPSLTLVVKGTFDPAASDPAPFADEQVPASGEVYWDDDVEQSPRAPSDFALLKPRGECFVIGKAWAPGGAPTSSLACSFKIGAIQKSFAVFGERRWEKGLVRRMSQPELFTEMALRMERAYGGPGHAPNPYGVGRESVDGEVRLPNLEQTRDLISAPNSKPAPVIIGALPIGWPDRMRYAGTYDQRYMSTRWPWLPEDFDWRFNLEAPPDQQLREGFWRGDEHIEVHNLHPSVPSIRSRLPGILPRVFLDITAPQPAFEEVKLVLDTVVWDAELGKLLLTWRGIVEVASEALDEIAHIFVAHDALADPPRQKDDLKARFDALLKEEEDEEEDAEGETPPAAEPAAEAPVEEEEASAEEVGEDEPEDPQDPQELSPEELELEAKMAELEAQMKALGIEPPPEPKEDAKPPDPKALLEQMRASGVEVPPELEQMMAELDAPEPEAEQEEEEATPTSPPELKGRELVEARIAADEPLTELDLTGADLSGMDLSERDLSGSIFKEARLHGVKLVRATLSGCVLAQSDLFRAECGEADFSDADLHGANLKWVDLMGATLEDATFEEACLVEARLSEVKAARAIFVGADLTQAVLVRGDFTEADFERATLDRVDAYEAKLLDATLEDASAEGARFERAIMTKVRAEGLRAKATRFGTIDAEDSFWERAELSQAVFSFARLTRADFSDATLIGAEMDGCAMREARFDRANAHSLKARKTDLMEASFDSAELSYADLRGSNCFGAEFWRAKTDGALFELTNLTRTKLEAR